MKNNKNLNLLTIDLEDYFQVENFNKIIKFSDWEKYESRIVQNTEKILHILAAANVKVTFFVLGWIAEKFPHLIKKIHQAHHEIASHGYAHRLIYNQTPNEFRKDLKKSKTILENIIHQPVLGYRAPNYSITKKSLWAFNILMEEGFKYDSSVFPIHHDKGGLREAKRFPHKISNNPGSFWEFPLSTVRILNQNFPFSGGGYFRLFPYGFIKWSIEVINRCGYPAVMYLHPWEFDPEQPKVKADCIARFRHYVNLSKTEHKMKTLLNNFRFKPIKDFLNEEGNLK